MKRLQGMKASLGRWASSRVSSERRRAFTLGCAVGIALAVIAAVVAGLSADRLSAALAGLMTPLIAIIGAYIAYQQWQTNRQKLEFDRYARRLEVYGRVSAFLGLVARDGAVKTPEALEFRRSVSEADFLFGRDRTITEYIDEVFRHGVRLASLGSERQGALDSDRQGFDFAKNADANDAELAWFMAQFDVARERFGEYLYMR